MNKAQLIEKIATESKISKAQAEAILDCTVDTIKKAVKKGDDVKLVGFGTFTKAKRKARGKRFSYLNHQICLGLHSSSK